MNIKMLMIPLLALQLTVTSVLANDNSSVLNTDTGLAKVQETKVEVDKIASTRWQYQPTEQDDGRAIRAEADRLRTNYTTLVEQNKREYTAYLRQREALLGDPNLQIEDLDALDAGWVARRSVLQEDGYARYDAYVAYTQSADVKAYNDRLADNKREYAALTAVQQLVRNPQALAHLTSTFTENGAYVRNTYLMAIAAQNGIDIEIVAGMARSMVASGGDATSTIAKQVAQSVGFGDEQGFVTAFSEIDAKVGGTLDRNKALNVFRTAKAEYISGQAQDASYATLGNTLLGVARWMGDAPHAETEITQAVREAKEGDDKRLRELEESTLGRVATKLTKISRDLGVSLPLSEANHMANTMLSGRPLGEILISLVPIRERTKKGHSRRPTTQVRNQRLTDIGILLSSLDVPAQQVQSFQGYVKKDKNLDISTNLGFEKALLAYKLAHNQANTDWVKNFVTNYAQDQR